MFSVGYLLSHWSAAAVSFLHNDIAIENSMYNEISIRTEIGRALYNKYLLD